MVDHLVIFVYPGDVDHGRAHPLLPAALKFIDPRLDCAEAFGAEASDWMAGVVIVQHSSPLLLKTPLAANLVREPSTTNPRDP